MSGINSTLSIAKTAIAAQQYGLAVTGNNIANVNNPDYSTQRSDQFNRDPALYGGFLFGTGVDSSQIRQNVDALLENRLTSEISTQAAFEEAESYMGIIEGYFDENSESSINSIMVEFWNSWHDLADNPLGSSERVAVYEKGRNLASRLNKANEDLEGIRTDINNEVASAIGQINSLAGQIADLNVQITGLEASRSANDLRDQRNALVDQLGELIDITTFDQSHGAISISAANGALLVSKSDHYSLSQQGERIMWQGSYGADLDITDNITGGKLGGWLDMRDEIIPKFSSELDVLAKETIWAMNYQHSQGSGLEYYTDEVTGVYQADQSGLLSSYDFGNKIDYTKEFIMWLQDNTTIDSQYARTEIDMGLSEAEISNWQGSAPGQVQSRYKLTVMDGATLGEKEVMETDGINLAEVRSSTSDVAAALDSAIADQTLTISNSPSGTQVIEVRDLGGDAQRSAASLAETLSAVDGVQAYASEVSATFDVAGISNAQEGDEIQFSLYADGVVLEQRFTVDTDSGNIPLATAISEGFENALRDAAERINDINSDQDLFTSGLNINSSAGRTLGIQDFKVVDNTGVRLDTFNNFSSGSTITFVVDSVAALPADSTSTVVSFDLGPEDVTGQAELSAAFYENLARELEGTPVSVEHDPATNSVILRTTDGSNLRLRDGDSSVGAGVDMDVTELSGTAPPIAGDRDFNFDGSGDSVTFSPAANIPPADTIGFSGQGTSATIEESDSGGITAGVITGTLTLMTDPGMQIHSTASAAGGIFDGNNAKVGSSIVTFGGEGGYGSFTAGDAIEFELDGTLISFTAGATELAHASNLFAALDGALTAPAYEVVQAGTSVSVLRNISSDAPIEITDFSDTTTGDATLSITTGTGNGTSDPENDLLISDSTYRDSATSSLYADSGIIKWEKYDADGLFTGEDGLIEVEEEGRVTIMEPGGPSLWFDISAGELVAGNTLTINTDTSGSPDPLDFRVRGSANNKNEIYTFTIATGGKVGELVDDDDTLTVEWKTSTDSGTFQLKGEDPPQTPETPIEVEVDGMTLLFYDGTLFKNDVFTITTDESGVPVSTNENGMPSGELLSDWHWTQDSFADQFNRQAEGMRASVTLDHELKFETSSDYHAMTNLEYSGANGFSEENVIMTVTDWGALDFSADLLQFNRLSTGEWRIANDPTGGAAVFIPDGGDDDGFGVDFSGDGLADIEVTFVKKISGEGYVRFDLEERDRSDLSFAFSDDSVEASSGLLAAAGINTFFNGSDAMTMEINDALADTRYVAAARINSETGEISQGDNSNALAMANVQNKDITMKQWDYTRGAGGRSSLTTTSLDGYYSTITGSMGIIARRIQSSREFADIMVNNLTEQRNSISAVSLDEEMIRLMQYQHGFSAASKLLSVSDEMLNTLINMR